MKTYILTITATLDEEIHTNAVRETLDLWNVKYTELESFPIFTGVDLTDEQVDALRANKFVVVEENQTYTTQLG